VRHDDSCHCGSGEHYARARDLDVDDLHDMYLVHFVPQQCENEACKSDASGGNDDENSRHHDDRHDLLNLLNLLHLHRLLLHLFLLHRLHLL
jgi:hypothetical protein